MERVTWTSVLRASRHAFGVHLCMKRLGLPSTYALILGCHREAVASKDAEANCSE